MLAGLCWALCWAAALLLGRGGHRHRCVFAGGTAIDEVDMLQHAHLHRDDVELFADHAVDHHPGRAALAQAKGFGHVADDFYPFKFCW